MPTILIIGGVSRDILHIGGRAIASAGGAGLYTSMAAHRSGAKVSLFAPRPDPVPKMFQPVAQRLAAWLGPEVSPGALPRFEIARQGAQATYRQASFGAEAYLAPENLPPDLSSYDSVHIVPLGDVGRQLAFLGACRQRGARLISAGTYLDAVLGDPAAVGAVMEQALYPARSGGEAQITITFIAPDQSGINYSTWQAYTPDGEPFGDQFYVQVIVNPDLLATATPEAGEE